MDAAMEISRARRDLGDLEAYSRYARLPGHKVRWYIVAAGNALFLSFVIALMSLTIFACVNLPK
jgi:hypothetical protein